MADINDLITASSYNAIRAKVNKVVGTGDGAEFGYGQSLTSSLLADNDLITAQDMQNLFDDLVLAAKHQTGNPPVWTEAADGLDPPDAGDVVGVYAAALGPPDVNTGNRTSLNAVDGTDEGFLDFEQAAQQIETNHLQADASALNTSIGASSIRTSSWNTAINHTVTVQWQDANHRRYWANAGGKIRFNANLTGGTSQPGDETQTPPGTKDEIWQTMLNTMGTIEIGVLGTSNTGNGTPSALTSILYSNRSTKADWSQYDVDTPLNMFIKTGSGVYSENRYIIDAYEVADNAIRFNIQFLDFDVGDDLGGTGSTPIDENVSGTVESTLTLVTPNGFLDTEIPTVVSDSLL